MIVALSNSCSRSDWLWWSPRDSPSKKATMPKRGWTRLYNSSPSGILQRASLTRMMADQRPLYCYAPLNLQISFSHPSVLPAYSLPTCTGSTSPLLNEQCPTPFSSTLSGMTPHCTRFMAASASQTGW